MPSKIINNLYFLNHASFAIERDYEILLIDPWFEGAAFDNGWMLLDKSTSNILVIEWLERLNKKIYIWYSHEHSDHFSISFLKEIKKSKITPTIIFQKTLDCRVKKFLENHKFDIIIVKEGQKYEINEDFSITTWPHADGDSYCLIESGALSLLNINDCVISTKSQSEIIKKKINKISKKVDILLTQFGYANWAGNETDFQLRENLSQQKLKRILNQESELKPELIIPFASFVYFSHTDNFYLNDSQNTPAKLKSDPMLEGIQGKIFFLKPWDMISLENVAKIKIQIPKISETALKHWDTVLSNIYPTKSNKIIFEINELKICFNNFAKKMSLSFLFLPQILELIGIIKPIKIYINDIEKTVLVSYLRGFKFTKSAEYWDISISSEVFYFIFKNDFGFNTMHVNGRFKAGKNFKLFKLIKFFSFQELFKNGFDIKNGFGLMNPVSSVYFLINSISKLIYKIKSQNF